MENSYFFPDLKKIIIIFISFSWSGRQSETEGHSGSKAGETAGKRGEAGAREQHLEEPGTVGGHAQQDWHHPHTVCVCGVFKNIYIFYLFIFTCPSQSTALLHIKSLILYHFRRLSQRPTPEELEQRNILQGQYLQHTPVTDL